MDNSKTSLQTITSVPGQALLEFTMVLPVLILILVGTYLVSSAMYAGENAANNMKGTLLNKTLIAQDPNEINAGGLTSYINTGNNGPFPVDGDAVDLSLIHI